MSQVQDYAAKALLRSSASPEPPGEAPAAAGAAGAAAGPSAAPAQPPQDLLFSAPPPAHWDAMRPSEAGGVCIVRLPMPGARRRTRWPSLALARCCAHRRGKGALCAVQTGALRALACHVGRVPNPLRRRGVRPRGLQRGL